MERSATRPLVAIGALGTQVDRGVGPKRWEHWRPTVSLFQHEDLLISRFHLLRAPSHHALAQKVADDIRQVSPHTEVIFEDYEVENHWDFEEVYGATDELARRLAFDPEREDLLVHITTGSHVLQICLFLHTETRLLPGRLVQTSPPAGRQGPPRREIIDLDLSKYDAIARRFAAIAGEAVLALKGGIETRNKAFNQLIERIERVAVASRAPLLLIGPTGAGKTELARRLYALRKARRVVLGPLVEINCATLRGDGAMSALFGHKKGAFTGAAADRPGLLLSANGGMLFLDEVGELGLDEQAMLLRAVEGGAFLPVGADREVRSDFALVAGTNRDLGEAVRQGRFREDLLARLDLWTFALPSLADRREDIAPNLDHELARFAQREGRTVRFNREARDRYLQFATSPKASWRGNFRDLGASVTRMATLAPGGRVDTATVDEELARLDRRWASLDGRADDDGLDGLLAPDELEVIDPFDRVQLAYVVGVLKRAGALSAAGRELFAASRARKTSVNDADRLRKYLERFGIDKDRVLAR